MSKETISEDYFEFMLWTIVNKVDTKKREYKRKS